MTRTTHRRLLAETITCSPFSAFLRRFPGLLQILLIFGAAAAPPAQAQITFSGGTLQTYLRVAPLSPRGGEASLSTGAYGATISDYSITCYEDCDGLPFGGALASLTYSLNLTDAGLTWSAMSFQGVDSGDATNLEWYLEAFFTSPDHFGFQTVKSTNVDAACGLCSRSFSVGTSSWFDGSNWQGAVTIFGQGSLREGRQRLMQSVTANTVAFVSVPEPATWAMLILGFAVLGAAMRRVRTLPLGAMT